MLAVDKLDELDWIQLLSNEDIKNLNNQLDPLSFSQSLVSDDPEYV